MELYTSDLFAKDNKLRIIKINNLVGNARLHYGHMLRHLLSRHVEMYPDILKWFDKKVMPGIENSTREAYIGLYNEEPIASAVLKIAEKSKFCHLHIDEVLQGVNLGDLFFSMMALDAKRMAKEIHFTLPENLWKRKQQFFKSFGFQESSRSMKQYRAFDKELRCSASFDTVWSSVLDKIPNLIKVISQSANSTYNGILLSVQPNFSRLILTQKKIIEIRKKFSVKWIGKSAIIYSSSPIQAIQGRATIVKVIFDSPENIFKEYKQLIGDVGESYYRYTKNHEKVYALILDDIIPYATEVPILQIRQWLQMPLKPPQSYLSLENNPDWSIAISICELLQSQFNIQYSIFPRHKKKIKPTDERKKKAKIENHRLTKSSIKQLNLF